MRSVVHGPEKDSDLKAARKMFHQALSDVCDRKIGDRHHRPLARFRGILNTQWELAEHLLVQARGSGGPVIHTPAVFSLAMDIGRAQGMDENSLLLLGVAAIYHDVGYAEICGERQTISKGQIDQIENPEEREALRREAMEIRLEHMQRGAHIVNHLINGGYGLLEDVEGADIVIPELIGIHDNPTIAELQGDPADVAQWLFTSQELCGSGIPATAENLAPLLREADRLSMLTVEGVQADLDRTPVEQRRSPVDQLGYNFGRHIDEGKLYREAFPDASVLSGINEGDPFYRSAAAKRISEQLIAETRNYFTGRGHELQRASF